MATLRIRTIASNCDRPFPLSVRQDLLNGEAGALKEHLVALQAQCMPWEVIADSNHMAIHAALIPTGEILYFGGWFESEGIYRFDVRTAAITDTFASDLPNTDMFCGGHAFIAGGRLLVGGGELPALPDGGGEDLHGHGGMSGGGARACWIYDPFSLRWDSVAAFNLDPDGNLNSGGRWYPTLVTLYDNQVIAVGGHPDVREAYPVAPPNNRHSNNTPERYSPRNNTWTLLTAATTAINAIRDEYHRIFLLPNGLIFFATQVSALDDEEIVQFNRYYNPYSGTFLSDPQIAPPSEDIYHQGSRGSAVLLPLLPEDNYTPSILVCNGERPWRITLTNDPQNRPSWEIAGNRSWPDDEWPDGTGPMRNHACAVILADGTVFVTGGTQYAGAEDADRQANAVVEGEIYSPGTGQWITVEPASVRRHYHSTALLMPDGAVWTAGSNGPGGESNQERRIEVYRPPYCELLHRPEIIASPDRIIYGAAFEVRTSQAGLIQHVALIRNGSVTHAFDSDQRYVGLEFSHSGGDLLTVTAPPHGAVAPPGYYMLWIMDDTGRPCKLARFVNVNALSVRITAVACGISTPLSLLQDVFTVGDAQTISLIQQLYLMQQECLF